MQPDVSAQLAGMRRLLVDVVMPEVSSGYAKATLQTIVGGLDLVGRGLPNLAAFIEWDNESMRAILSRIAETAAPEVRELVAAGATSKPLLSRPNADVENAELRALMASVGKCLVQRGEWAQYSPLVDHLIARSYRYPLRMNLSAPTEKSDK